MANHRGYGTPAFNMSCRLLLEHKCATSPLRLPHLRLSFASKQYAKGSVLRGKLTDVRIDSIAAFFKRHLPCENWWSASCREVDRIAHQKSPLFKAIPAALLATAAVIVSLLAHEAFSHRHRFDLATVLAASPVPVSASITVDYPEDGSIFPPELRLPPSSGARAMRTRKNGG